MVCLEVHVEPEAGGRLVVALGARPLPQVRLRQVHLLQREGGRVGPLVNLGLNLNQIFTKWS